MKYRLVEHCKPYLLNPTPIIEGLFQRRNRLIIRFLMCWLILAILSIVIVLNCDISHTRSYNYLPTFPMRKLGMRDETSSLLLCSSQLWSMIFSQWSMINDIWSPNRFQKYEVSDMSSVFWFANSAIQTLKHELWEMKS